MSLTCLSKTLNPKDYEQLEIELCCVDEYPVALPHPHRRWEYALALQAIARWRERGGPWEGPIYDVGGGSGSPFHNMLRRWTGKDVTIVDPAVIDGYSLEDWVEEGGAPLSKTVTCISVIEHVPDIERFLYYLSCLIAPGGLLTLTMDYWNKCGEDTAQYHEQRARIYCPKVYTQLRNALVPLHLFPFGGVDSTWHGTQVFDYSFASLVLEKRR